MEKWRRFRLGVIFNCFEVREANSRAVIRPRIDTRRAANLAIGVIVSTGVLNK